MVRAKQGHLPCSVLQSPALRVNRPRGRFLEEPLEPGARDMPHNSDGVVEAIAVEARLVGVVDGIAFGEGPGRNSPDLRKPRKERP